MAVEEHTIQVEDNRSMLVRVDGEKRTVELEMPGNYDLATTYLVSNGETELGLSTGKVRVKTGGEGKVFGTVFRFKRNQKRKGSPRGTRKA